MQANGSMVPALEAEAKRVHQDSIVANRVPKNLKLQHVTELHVFQSQ